ncbi:MAG: hypothetical protein K2Y05_11490 [Hyphomicrobiaceae bacterium]|nr:hypothetical protein [Hyphomicrobiaceae bacterium]
MSTIATVVAALDANTALAWAMHYRPLLELIGVVSISALIGFFAGRFIYKGQVQNRTKELRAEYVLSRRRLAAARSGLSQARDEQARATRRMKREQYSARPPVQQ